MTSSAKQGALHTFIVIGAMKSGTTSLYYTLRQHPDVEMAAVHETDFFMAEKNWSKGHGWYRSLFEGKRDVRGDVSPNYSKAHCFPGVPKRMQSIVPNVRLIYLVRDPIDRIRSHYVHNYAARAENRSLHDTVTAAPIEENHYVKCSAYHWQLQQYLEMFDTSQILIVAAEELWEDRVSVLKTIYSFIGVDPEYAEDQPEMHRHKSKDKKRIPRFEAYVTDKYTRALLRRVLPATWSDPEPFSPPSISNTNYL